MWLEGNHENLYYVLQVASYTIKNKQTEILKTEEGLISTTKSNKYILTSTLKKFDVTVVKNQPL